MLSMHADNSATWTEKGRQQDFHPLKARAESTEGKVSVSVPLGDSLLLQVHGLKMEWNELAAQKTAVVELIPQGAAPTFSGSAAQASEWRVESRTKGTLKDGFKLWFNGRLKAGDAAGTLEAVLVVPPPEIRPPQEPLQSPAEN